MNAKTNAASLVGVTSLHVQTSQVVALVNTGALALDLWRTEQAAVGLHDVYLRRIREYEGRHGAVTVRINLRNREHVAVITYTIDERVSLMAVRRKDYAARRRLRAACAKAARTAASIAGATRG